MIEGLSGEINSLTSLITFSESSSLLNLSFLALITSDLVTFEFAAEELFFSKIADPDSSS